MLKMTAEEKSETIRKMREMERAKGVSFLSQSLRAPKAESGNEAKFAALPRIFHPLGRFEDPVRGRFDYIFSEFIGRPSLPVALFPTIRELEEVGMPGTRFHGQRSGRDVVTVGVPRRHQFVLNSLRPIFRTRETASHAGS